MGAAGRLEYRVSMSYELLSAEMPKNLVAARLHTKPFPNTFSATRRAGVARERREIEVPTREAPRENRAMTTRRGGEGFASWMVFAGESRSKHTQPPTPLPFGERVVVPLFESGHASRCYRRVQ